MAEAGLAPSRQQAQALILAGRVRVRGEVVRRPAAPVQAVQEIEVQGRRWASRGALKLGPALDYFQIQPAGRVCADVGASTGGFSDVLLDRGAALVFAVDVGRGLLDWRLRSDPRVHLMERTNARHLTSYPQPVSLQVVDLSFISLRQVLPALRQSAPASELVVLFKPQFEVGREHVGKRGVVRDEAAVQAALADFQAWTAENGFEWLGSVAAAIKGGEGNQEWMVHLRCR